VQVNVAEVSTSDRDTVVFRLKPNSRFTLFTVRWNAMWMMPKHVFGNPSLVSSRSIRR
jgi:peptide/nickel transport system substrate-binding protein